VGNYPGVTVEKKTGFIKDVGGSKIRVHDLPGLYSLIPKSLDDKIATDILFQRLEESSHLKLVVVVADASNLARNLYLVTQIIDLSLPVILALNMFDVALKNGLNIDVLELSRELRVPVIPIVANKQKGIPELRKCIFEIISSETHEIFPKEWNLGDDVKNAVKPIHSWFLDNSNLGEAACLAEAMRVLSNDTALEHWIIHSNGSSYDSGVELNLLVKKARDELMGKNIPWRMYEAKVRYEWIDEICKKTISEGKTGHSLTEKADQILTHRIAGPVIFLVIFAVIFQAIFSWAEMPMGLIEDFVSWFGGKIALILPDGILKDLTVDGAIAGVGAILVFLPQILFLFFFLSILEDTGYLARVAFIMDRLLRPAGLSGRSVIPLLSSFACAIPGIMATRTIQNWRDRIITIMIAPLMSCSARLPVYTLMIAAFIPHKKMLGIFSLPGLTLLSMYLLGIFMAVNAAYVFKHFVGRKEKSSTFVMELPPYRTPSIKWTILQMSERAKLFVMNAGQIILAISIILWFLASFPKPENPELVKPSEAIRQSYAGKIGKFIEPAIEPLGFDWKLGIGLITSFAAREVLVSTMATIYNVEGSDENSVNLRDAMRNDRDPETGKPIYTPLVAISLMVFFVLACQCMATVAVVKRETNSWRWPLIMIAYMTSLAYISSLIVFQGGKLLGL
jgi:ferrous iron transport protein B